MPLPRRSALLALTQSAASPGLRAQGHRAIRLIAPFTPGGSTDILARALAPCALSAAEILRGRGVLRAGRVKAD